MLFQPAVRAIPMRRAFLLALAFVFAARRAADPFAAELPLPGEPALLRADLPGSRDRVAASSRVFASLSVRGQVAFVVLRTAKVFTSSVVGNGRPSPHAVAFRILLTESHGAEAFRELMAASPYAPRLYGLAGVYLLDPALFAAHAHDFQSDDSPVQTFVGCAFVLKPANQVVLGIASGDWPSDLARKRPGA